MTQQQIHGLLIDLAESGSVLVDSLDDARSVAYAAGFSGCRILRQREGWSVELVRRRQHAIVRRSFTAQERLAAIAVSILLILAASAGWWEPLLPW